MNEATESAKFWYGLGGYFVGITVMLIVCVAIIFCQGRRTMLVLSRKLLKKNASPATAETVTITCTCGMHGQVKTLGIKGSKVALGFEFPEGVTISRDKITPDEVMVDTIE
jgi:sRNA-binding carbon storage regulator CsrA